MTSVERFWNSPPGFSRALESFENRSRLLIGHRRDRFHELASRLGATVWRNDRIVEKNTTTTEMEISHECKCIPKKADNIVMQISNGKCLFVCLFLHFISIDLRFNLSV